MSWASAAPPPFPAGGAGQTSRVPRTPRSAATFLSANDELEPDDGMLLPRVGHAVQLEKGQSDALFQKIKRVSITKIGGSEANKEETRFALHTIARAITRNGLDEDASFDILETVFQGEARRHVVMQRKAGVSVVMVFNSLYKYCSETLDLDEVEKRIEALVSVCVMACSPDLP